MIETFDDYIEENPYDPSHAAKHFQTEQEFIDADLRYRDAREQDIWIYQQEKIDKLKKLLENFVEMQFTAAYKSKNDLREIETV
jgi:hypothetical protein